MQLIRSVTIRNFRSVRQLTLTDLDDYSPIVGLNGTGKSNILRALNLFFNGVVDESGSPLDFRRDFPARSKDKRVVSVEVTFSTRTGWKVRGADRLMSEVLSSGADRLTVDRSWSYSADGPRERLDYSIGDQPRQEASSDRRDELLSYIRSIEFRYVPNHVRPADLIASEIQTLRTYLFQRLKLNPHYRAAAVDETLAGLDRVASDLIAPLSQRVVRGAGELTGVNPDLPKTLADLVFSVGLQMINRAGDALAPEMHGSGTQSFLLMHVLDLLDRSSRGQNFGWRQASVWAIEERESFLHSGLRGRYASDLARYATDPRRQVLTTTHEDDFVRTARSAWLVSLEGGATVADRMAARDAIGRSDRLRITSYRHPLLNYPDDPLVLVEGRSDAKVLEAAVRASGIKPRWRLASLDGLDERLSGGDAAVKFLESNLTAVASRADSAPLLVLRDWEDRKEASIDRALALHPYSKRLRCPEQDVNPQLGETFRGIERYMLTAPIRSRTQPDWLVRGVSREYPLELRLRIRENEKAAWKQALADAISNGQEIPGDYLVRLAKWLNQQVESALQPLSPFFGVVAAP